MRWVVNATPRPNYPREKNQYPLYRRLGGPQGRSGLVRKISPPSGIDPRVFQPVASCYTDYAIPVAGSIPDGVTGIFHSHNTSSHSMALGSTQPLTEISTSNNSRREAKVAGGYGWQPYHFHVTIVLKSGSLKLLEPSGPVQACNGIALHFVSHWSD
jgi:hypothetical protein